MNRSASKLGVFVVAVLLLSAVSSWAQSSGAITGTLVDPRGALIAGASVQAFDEAKGVIVRTTTSGADGLFQLQPLQPGKYSVRVKANGMKEMERRNLVLDSRQVLGLGEVQLQLGSVNETMTVEAQTPLVETANADHSAVIDSKLVTETSLNGRDFQSLVKTLPGVVSNDSSDFRLAFNNTNSFHVNGMRGSQNNFFLDGVVNTDVGANDGQFTQLSMDAVGEFKLLTNNFGAEYGRNPGVIMEVNTKSGGRQFHGSLYEFNREDGFDAAPFGSQGVKGTLRFHQYGGNVGGPIPIPHFKDKLFFFFNYEGTKAIQPNSHIQYASATEPGLGIGYKLPDPKWLGIGTPNGDLDFTSAYQFDPNTHAPLPLGSSGFQQGQIFVPGSITGYDSSGNPTGGVPICGTASAPCNIVPGSMLSAQAGAMKRESKYSTSC